MYIADIKIELLNQPWSEAAHVVNDETMQNHVLLTRYTILGLVFGGT